MIERLLIFVGLAAILFSYGITDDKIIIILCVVIMLSLSVIITRRFFAWLMLIFPFIVTGICLYIDGKNGLLAVMAGLLVLLVIISIYSEKIEELKSKLIEIRDRDAEYSMELRKKNKLILENQDNEIRLATLNERNRIAREIHDNVGHMLSRALIMAGAIGTVNKDETVGKNLEMLEKTLDTAMTEVRKSVHDLHDDSIDVKSNICEIADSLKPSREVEVVFDMSMDADRDMKLTFISICKEAASNIIKHSDANKVKFMIVEQPGFYSLSISDNGHLTEKNINRITTGINSGIGLENIRDRVSMLNGIVTFTTDNGFKIHVTIPKESKEGR